MSSTLLIGVSGMPGAGKTTMVKTLARRLALQPALESIGDQNPWLEPFYGEPDGMRRYALNLQLHFLATRMESLRAMRAQGGNWLLDRTWYEDAEIFARGLYEQGLMHEHEFSLYERLYTELLHSPAARPPDLLLFLGGPMETIVSRIHARGRPKEKDTPLAYWEQLYGRYDRWLQTFTACPVLYLDVRRYDFLRDPYAIDNLLEHLRDVVGPEHLASLRGQVAGTATRDGDAPARTPMPAESATPSRVPMRR